MGSIFCTKREDDLASCQIKSNQRTIAELKLQVQDDFFLKSNWLLYGPETVYESQNVSQVYLCVGKKIPLVSCVMKVIHFSPHQKKAAMFELDLMRRAQGPNVISVITHYETKTSIGIVLPLAMCDLLEFIVKAPTHRILPPAAIPIMLSILAAAESLHSIGIIHRDIKPENIVLVNGVWKLIDFGLATDCKEPNMCCGTLLYAAPEIFYGHCYTESVDMWSIGVTFYVMLAGYHPFNYATSAQVRAHVMRGDVQFQGRIWKNIHPKFKALVKGLICLKVKDRLSADATIDLLSRF